MHNGRSMETFDIDENWSVNEIFVVKYKDRRIYFKNYFRKNNRV